MPRIFDNIDRPLLTALQDSLQISDRADFCVGYFNLRGWRKIDSLIDSWAGKEGSCVRLLVGMQSWPQEELRTIMKIGEQFDGLDQQEVSRLKKRVAEDFRQQLMFGAPSNEDEVGLRRLSKQIKARQVIVKLFLRSNLHAKLYLCHRNDPNNPTIGFVGSSNLTLAGLSRQGELNVDVLDQDACSKLQQWFSDRWDDRWCLDISDELAEIIDNSWARETPLQPYEIYMKMAYHLSQEARAGISEFQVPNDFGHDLLEFQTAAVKIAAHHLNKRGGVLLGDVVGLGKTLMATALARIFQDDQSTETLIICPKNLVKMWQDYVDRYRLLARVISLSVVTHELPNLRRYRIVVIDESHNLRNREGKRYRAIQEYIAENESRCILLSATPYNKSYLDLSSQLRLFVPEDLDLGLRPERIIREITETEFLRRYQSPVRSLAAFEKSPYPDDWRDLMRLYLVRRTRSFIQDNYATIDPQEGRRYLSFDNGARFYFPVRVPRTVKFQIDPKDPLDPYARLQSPKVVATINSLSLPRYGMGNYLAATPDVPPSPAEIRTIAGLSRAGKRLMGFCRTNLFKRLESGGPAFIQSLERHALRNYIFLHAIENDLELPLGTQDAALLDAETEDIDQEDASINLFDDEGVDVELKTPVLGLVSESDYRNRAEQVYNQYSDQYRNRFKWIKPRFFVKALETDLAIDASNILDILDSCGRWESELDEKLRSLIELITRTHPSEKVLVFSQFADTVNYLARELEARAIGPLESVTGESQDPTQIAWRFSPRSNGKTNLIDTDNEIRVLIATDVISEGQNLQDCSIIVNYDLPWAIIRIIQRAGRVDRIGQTADEVTCYSFLPSDGIEQVIQLRDRVRARLRENAEVVGTDEAFFEDEHDESLVIDLYNEKAGILDGDGDTEVDLASYAYQIWKNATDADPDLQKKITELPDVVYSSKTKIEDEYGASGGALVYVRTGQGNDALAWIDRTGKSVTESQFAVLRAAECLPTTPAVQRAENHHELVQRATQLIATEEKTVGGQLGRPAGARFRTYERLKRYAEDVSGTIFSSSELLSALNEIYQYPLRQFATDSLNRQLKSGVSDSTLATLVLALREEGRLCSVHDAATEAEPQIVCSLGLISTSKGCS